MRLEQAAKDYSYSNSHLTNRTLTCCPRSRESLPRSIVEPGGTLVISMPYHGYFKNLALALCGAMDRHFTVLWDGGHIKFFSIKTLSALLSEAGFSNIRFARVGRIPPFAKSMIAIATKT